MSINLYKLQSVRDPAPDGAHAWIQWKGTSVCMDVRCECGDLMHVDAYGAYYVRCLSCDRMYATQCNIKLSKIEGDERAEVERLECFVEAE